MANFMVLLKGWYCKMPNTEDKILNYLLHDYSLTTLEAWQKFHTSELRHYISRLSRRGYIIKSEWIKAECSDGHTAKIKRYWIG